MSVYVDPLMACVRSNVWPYDQACHLFADTEAELHAFAARLGLKRAWFQSGTRNGKNCLDHYDLTRNMREKALNFGAVQVGHERTMAIRDKQRASRAAEKASGTLFKENYR